jgi:hypothetical protein
MGDKQNRPPQLSFNGLLKIDFQGSRITSDGGLILVRGLDRHPGLSMDSAEIPVYGQQAVKITRLSCHRLRSNEVRLCLSVIAYNLGDPWRRLVLPRRIEKWPLTSL